MYQNSCAAAASTGGCVETDRECHSLISREPAIPAIEHDYSGFDIVKATQVHFCSNNSSNVNQLCFVYVLVWSISTCERTCRSWI